MLNKLSRQMMFPESIAFFLIALVFNPSAGSPEENIEIKVTEETRAEGSCVTISCTYKHRRHDENFKLLWFKDPVYDQVKKEYTGTIVYSNTADRPQSPGYSSRVKYITGEAKDDRRKCDLIINDLQKTDSGNYGLRIIYSHIDKYMSKAYMKLTVTDNPCKVNIEPSEMKISVKEWDELSVHCSTSDSCPFDPEWILYKSERVTSSFTQENNEKMTKLNFKPTWQDDNMILSCHSANTQDRCLFKNITLSVEYAPKETKATVISKFIKERDSVILSCSSRGRPNATMTWFKNGIKKSPTTEWRLVDVTPVDSGKYYCEAENKHGTARSNTIDINVKYGPKNVSVTPVVNIYNLIEGDKMKLNCSVGSSNPAVHKFQWYFNDSILDQQTSQILSISHIRPEDKGPYHCKVYNEITTAESKKLQVSVKYSPRIKIDDKTSLKKGCKVELNCFADANPPPNSYSWKHTSASESLPLSFSNTTGVLTIEAVTIRHEGKYTCVATNYIGRGENSTNVTVLYPPSQPILTMKSEGGYGVISITCTVESSPASNLTVNGPTDLKSMWESKMNIIQSDNKVTIYLNVSQSDAGVYKCKADNSEGTNKTEEELLYAPKNVSVGSEGEQITGHKLTLACNTQSKPTPFSYKWKKHINGELKQVGASKELHFHSLQTADSGQYICIVDNKIGIVKSLPININVKLDSLSVLYRVIFSILLLILIALVIFLLSRKFIKGSQNNSQENLAMADTADSSQERIADLYTTVHSAGHVRTQVSSARPASNTRAVYSEITFPQMMQGCSNPKDHEDDRSINYASLDFKSQNERPKRASDDSSSAIYSKVMKKKPSQNLESELHDYENVSSACAPKLPLANTDWESDTSEEDEVKYKTVSLVVRPGVREPRKKISSSSSTTSSEEERTVYSDVKT